MPQPQQEQRQEENARTTTWYTVVLVLVLVPRIVRRKWGKIPTREQQQQSCRRQPRLLSPMQDATSNMQPPKTQGTVGSNGKCICL